MPIIETYFAVKTSAINILRLTRLIGPLLHTRAVKNLLQWVIRRVNPHGPSRKQNETGFSLMVGEMRDAERVVRTRMRVPEGYWLTMLTTVEIMKRILNGDLKTGFQTPSLAYDTDFILQFAGVQREDLQ